MDSSFLNVAGVAIVLDMIVTIKTNRAYLSEIDGAIGDGDHGVNMSKGFTICGERLKGQGLDLSESLHTLGDTLLVDIGGSMGPIYGSLFLGMSRAIAGQEVINKDVFGQMLEGGLIGVTSIVTTPCGDKTLMDTLIPAVREYTNALAHGKTFEVALEDMKTAAERGKDSTKDMIARVGRASRLGERSRGVLDAGATSCFLIIDSMCTSTKCLLETG